MAPIHDAAAAGNVSEVRRLVEQVGVEPSVLEEEDDDGDNDVDEEEEEDADAHGRRAPIHRAAANNVGGSLGELS